MRNTYARQTRRVICKVKRRRIVGQNSPEGRSRRFKVFGAESRMRPREYRLENDRIKKRASTGWTGGTAIVLARTRFDLAIAARTSLSRVSHGVARECIEMKSLASFASRRTVTIVHRPIVRPT